MTEPNRGEEKRLNGHHLVAREGNFGMIWECMECGKKATSTEPFNEVDKIGECEA